nr:hypothetical protein Itr_chr07CG07470 [Ipomoea trifida]
MSSPSDLWSRSLVPKMRTPRFSGLSTKKKRNLQCSSPSEANTSYQMKTRVKSLTDSSLATLTSLGFYGSLKDRPRNRLRLAGKFLRQSRGERFSCQNRFFKYD